LTIQLFGKPLVFARWLVVFVHISNDFRLCIRSSVRIGQIMGRRGHPWPSQPRRSATQIVSFLPWRGLARVMAQI
jgi:hypothetical protein